MSDDSNNIDTPEVCAARAADPAWREEQARKSQAASDRFAAYRESIDMPLVPKGAGERF
jgi:hypothetical protein